MDCNTIRNLQSQINQLQEQLSAASREVCPIQNLCNQSLIQESYREQQRPQVPLPGNTSLPVNINLTQQRQPHNTSPTPSKPNPAPQNAKNPSPTAANNRQQQTPTVNLPVGGQQLRPGIPTNIRP